MDNILTTEFFTLKVWPILHTAPGILLLAMIIEWLIPYPYFLRLNKLIPVFSQLGRKVNKLGNSPKQQILASILLPIIIIVPLYACIICTKIVTGLPEAIDFICLLLILESRPPRTVAKKIRSLLITNTDESKASARKILSNFVLRVTTKLSSMGMAKATCESSTVRLLNNFYVPAFIYLFLGIECAIFARLVAIMSMSFNIKLAINQNFGVLMYRMSQLIFCIPSLFMLLVISAIPHKGNVSMAIMNAIQTWPSKTTGVVMASIGAILDVKLGGPRFYMINKYLYPTIGGTKDPDANDIKRFVNRTSFYIWVAMLLLMGLYLLFKFY